eukprot:6634661-Alexandrium_andersonii.AAC.1
MLASGAEALAREAAGLKVTLEGFGGSPLIHSFEDTEVRAVQVGHEPPLCGVLLRSELHLELDLELLESKAFGHHPGTVHSECEARGNAELLIEGRGDDRLGDPGVR